MTSFPVNTRETAPEGSRPLIDAVQKAYGFLPNLAAVMSTAPALLEGYMALSAAFARSSLSASEQQVVLLAASAENECDYCMAAHSTVGAKAGVPAQAIAALRNGSAIEDARLEALRSFTTRVVATRGRPGEQDLAAFSAAGFTAAQVLEVLTGVGVKTLTNYTNHITNTPLDRAFAPQRWHKESVLEG